MADQETTLQEIEAKANPNVVLVLNYAAAGVLLGSLYYAGVILGKVDANIAVMAITGALAGLGVYKAQA